jgi:hypothetical protein
VRRPSGATVAGAGVTITAFREQCGGEEVESAFEDARVATDAAGEYGYRYITVTGPFTGCLRVTAQEPGAMPEDPGVTVEGSTVGFLPDFGTDQKRDSAQVDVVIPLP